MTQQNGFTVQRSPSQCHGTKSRLDREFILTLDGSSVVTLIYLEANGKDEAQNAILPTGCYNPLHRPVNFVICAK